MKNFKKTKLAIAAMLFSGFVHATGPEVSYAIDPPEANFYATCDDGYNGEAVCDFEAYPVDCYGTFGNICEHTWFLGGRGHYNDASFNEEWINWSYIDPGFYDVILVVTDGLNQSSSVTKRVFAGDPLDNPEIKNMHISGTKENGIVEVTITYETRFYDGGGLGKFHLVLLDGVPYSREYNNGTYVDVWDHNRKSAEYTICRRDYPDLCASVSGELEGQTVVEVTE